MSVVRNSSRVSWCSSCAAKRPWMCQAENTSDCRACKKKPDLKYVVLSSKKKSRFEITVTTVFREKSAKGPVIPESREIIKVVVFKHASRFQNTETVQSICAQVLFRRGSQVESKRRTYPKPLKQRQEMDINCMK